MIKFEKTKSESVYNDVSDVVISMENDLTLEEILEQFKRFLMVCGYCIGFDEELDIVKEDDNLNEDELKEELVKELKLKEDDLKEELTKRTRKLVKELKPYIISDYNPDGVFTLEYVLKHFLNISEDEYYEYLKELNVEKAKKLYETGNIDEKSTILNVNCLSVSGCNKPYCPDLWDEDAHEYDTMIANTHKNNHDKQSVTIEMTDDEFDKLTTIANERNITINELSNAMLKEYVDMNKNKSFNELASILKSEFSDLEKKDETLKDFTPPVLKPKIANDDGSPMHIVGQ